LNLLAGPTIGHLLNFWVFFSYSSQEEKNKSSANLESKADYSKRRNYLPTKPTTLLDFKKKIYLRTCNFTNGGFKKEGKDTILVIMCGTYL